MSEEKSCHSCGCKHLPGIACDVKNCVYHAEDTYCTADEIAVGPSYATNSNDTACATFKEKTEG